MLVIRLARTGRKKYSTYRLVVADSRKAATGKFVSLLGHYNPHTKALIVNSEETLRYLKNGAQPSNTVVRLLQSQKLELPEWVEYHSRPPKAKKKAEKPVATEPSAVAESSEAAPAESPEP